jgi:transcriptional regulator
MPEPWGFRDDDEFVCRLAASVVAFQVEITRIEGKWKLGQNHPRERREKVIDALAQQRDENSQAIAALMARTLHEQE